MTRKCSRKSNSDSRIAPTKISKKFYIIIKEGSNYTDMALDIALSLIEQKEITAKFIQLQQSFTEDMDE